MQEYWSGLSCPPSGNLPKPGIKPRFPAMQVDSLASETPGKTRKNLGSLSKDLVPSLMLLYSLLALSFA